jgi:mono/diheme cytochrome c family protein
MGLRKEMAVGFTIALLLGGTALAQVRTQRGGSPEAAEMTNPTAADKTSISRGKEYYDEHCASCHKADAAGVEGGMGESGPPASNLIDDHADFGGSDGEIFAVIRGGVLPDLYMPMYEGVISDDAIWDVVNYLNTLEE